MAAELQHPYVSPDDYLATERAAEYKSEYYAGEILAMSGASRRHEAIVVNLIAELRDSLRGQPCKPMGGNLRVRVRRTHYLYPDLTVTCGNMEFADDELLDTLLNPTVIFEILSPSTESRDRSLKLRLYQQIESLRHYVLISQSTANVEVFTRQGGNDWLMHTDSGLESETALPAISVTIKLADLYDDVELTADPDIVL